MIITAKTTLVAMRMPVVVEKDGRRYSLDIADDSKGVDLVITRKEEGTRDEGRGGGERSREEVEVKK